MVETCIAEGLVGGRAFSLDASFIKADVNQLKRVPGVGPIEWPEPDQASRAVAEYLSTLGSGPERKGEGGQADKAAQGNLLNRSTSDLGGEGEDAANVCLLHKLSDR